MGGGIDSQRNVIEGHVVFITNDDPTVHGINRIDQIEIRLIVEI